MSYVTKMGAYGLAVAAAFAVALAVLLSVSTPTAEAVLQQKNADGELVTHNGSAENGDTVYVRFNNDGYATFTISTTGSAAASFVHTDADTNGQTIVCGPVLAAAAEGACDAQADDSQVTVAVKIDDDSGKGVIFVNQKAITGGGTETTDAISVSVKQVPTTLTAKAATSSIDSKGVNAEPTSAGTTYVDIRLTDSNNKGIAGESITIVSTRAVLSTAASPLNSRAIIVGGVTENAALGPFAGASLAGTVTTSDDAGDEADVDTAGYGRVVVTGAGSAGVSTITVTMGDLTATADIVLHGVVKAISAELEEGAIEVGGKTRIVVTALDAGDNPVANQNISVKLKGGVTPPEKLAKPVATSNLVNKDGGTQGSLKDKGDIPACGDIGGTDDDAGTPDVNEAEAASAGTNDAGQCVIEVSAPGGGTTTTTDDAARGTHTIVLVANSTGGDSPRGVNEAEVDIQVGGSPAIIEHDAPARIDASAEITVNVTVIDDESVRVGGVDIEVIHTAGDGAIITNIASRTKDGRAKFTYLAPSTPGVTEFLVRTKSGSRVTAQEPIIVAIGEAVEDPPPSLSSAPSASGFTLVTFSGGSVEELGEVVTTSCGGGGTAYATDYQGNWVSYIPAAMIPAVNATFGALFSDGVPANTPLLIGNCGG